MSLDPLPTNKDIIEKVEELLEAAFDEKKEFNTALNGGMPIKIRLFRNVPVVFHWAG